MSNKPILFSAPMVRALLAGTKTQTRRILKPAPVETEPGCWHIKYPGAGGMLGVPTEDMPKYAVHAARCEAGDRLWVREAWRTEARFDDRPPRNVPPGEFVSYEADYPAVGINYGCQGRYRNSQFMPRWASRLTLTVTDVRVERLQDISEADALAEGVIACRGAMTGVFVVDGCREATCDSAREAYSVLWESINGEDSWAENPWVAAITFTVEKRNIDAGKAVA